MKPNPWFIPGLATLAAGSWILFQNHQTATLVDKIAVFEKRIQQARLSAPDDDASPHTSPNNRNQPPSKIDWKQLAAKIGGINSGMIADMRGFMHMQRQLLDMSAGDIQAALEEIENLEDVTDQAREMLRSLLFGALTEKDPQAALEIFASSLGDQDSTVNWQMAGALSLWAKKDPAAATAWLDHQIASGKLESKSLDGKSQIRTTFERLLINALLEADPSAATARVLAMPEAQRNELFEHGMLFHITPATQAAYAAMVRETMPADKVGGILAGTAASFIFQGGSGSYQRADEFITNTAASASEKSAIVSAVMQSQFRNPNQKTGPAEIDQAREWGARHAPDVVDKATGDALADGLWHNRSFEEQSRLVLQYNDASANDDTLVSFLKNPAVMHMNQEAARSLIERIKDPARRQEILALPSYKTREQP